MKIWTKEDLDDMCMWYKDLLNAHATEVHKNLVDRYIPAQKPNFDSKIEVKGCQRP